MGFDDIIRVDVINQCITIVRDSRWTWSIAHAHILFYIAYPYVALSRSCFHASANSHLYLRQCENDTFSYRYKHGKVV